VSRKQRARHQASLGEESPAPAEEDEPQGRKQMKRREITITDSTVYYCNRVVFRRGEVRFFAAPRTCRGSLCSAPQRAPPRPSRRTKDDGRTRSYRRSGHAGQAPRAQAVLRDPSRCTSPLDAHTCSALPPATRHGGTSLHNPARAGLIPQTALLPRPRSIPRPRSTRPQSARPLSLWRGTMLKHVQQLRLRRRLR
jgi:hypothetical protein